MKALSPCGGNLAVYLAHCKSYAIAKRVNRVSSNVTRVDMSAPMPTNGLFRFRCIPAYRSPEALELRQRVADILRMERHINAA